MKFYRAIVIGACLFIGGMNAYGLKQEVDLVMIAVGERNLERGLRPVTREDILRGMPAPREMVPRVVTLSGAGVVAGVAEVAGAGVVRFMSVIQRVIASLVVQRVIASLDDDLSL